MKRCLFFLSFITFSTQAQSPKSLIEHYNLLPEIYTGGYKLFFKSGKWQAKSSHMDVMLEVVMDKQHEFIEINDPGSDGSTTLLQVSLYRLNDNSALVAVSRAVLNETGGSGKINFLQFEEGRWTDRTARTLPRITPQLFMNQGFVMPKVPVREFNLALPVTYTLSPEKTPVLARLRPATALYCSGAITDKPEIKEAFCEIEKNILYDQIELLWDKNKGKFSLGNKSRMP
jgi:hypothetical protein